MKLSKMLDMLAENGYSYYIRAMGNPYCAQIKMRASNDSVTHDVEASTPKEAAQKMLVNLGLVEDDTLDRMRESSKNTVDSARLMGAVEDSTAGTYVTGIYYDGSFAWAGHKNEKISRLEAIEIVRFARQGYMPNWLFNPGAIFRDSIKKLLPNYLFKTGLEYGAMIALVHVFGITDEELEGE